MRWLIVFVCLAAAVSGCRGRRGGTIACEPGDVVAIGCTSTLGMRCTGDPVLAACDATLVPDPYECTRLNAIEYSDDFDGTCPRAVLTCPASGSVSVNPNVDATSTTGWSCEFALEVLPPTSSTETCTPGESLVVGCDSTVGTLCTGDPTIAVCDATIVTDPESCLRSGTSTLFDDDDSGDDLCPRATGTCPASGRIAVNANAFGGGAFECRYAVMRGTVGP